MDKTGGSDYHLLKKPRVFYGYWIVAATLLCTVILSGSAFFFFILFVKSLEADFGLSRAGIMTAFTIWVLILGLASPFIGIVVDRYGVRIVIFTGALIAGLGFVLLSLMNDLWQFYIGWAVVGIGGAAMGIVPATAVVSNWFKKRRGLAIGAMSMGLGAGGFVMAPLIGGYLIPNFGWRSSYLVLALIIWVFVIPLALLVIKTKPADMGLYPDGIATPETEAMTGTSKGLTLKMALATSSFWLIAISFLLHQFSQVGIIQSQTPYLEDVGFSAATAAAALGGFGIMGAIGFLGFGWLCDHISAKYACSISLVLQLAAVIILMGIEPTSPLAMIWLYVVIMGLGGSAFLPTMSMLVSTHFGPASYGVIFGVVIFIQDIGGAAGPLTAGYMYDTMNTYHWVFILFLVAFVIALLTILVLRRPKSV